MNHASEMASRIADALELDFPLPPTDADLFIRAMSEELPIGEVAEIVRILQPLIRGCDWPRYLSIEELPLDGLILPERDDLESQSSIHRDISQFENDPDMQDIQHRTERHEQWKTAESPLVREVEELLGADTDAIDKFTEAIGLPSSGCLELTQMGKQLPERLLANLPVMSPAEAHSHTCCKFLHTVLSAIGTRGRNSPEVIRLCGKEIGFLFPTEKEARSGTYRFRQVRYLVEDQVASSPNDFEAVAWLAELTLRAGDENAAAPLVKRVWFLSQGCDPSNLARLVNFSLARDWYYGEPSFDGDGNPGGLLGLEEGEWFDRKEPLAHALLRRAFEFDAWDADTVATMQNLCLNEPTHGLSDDIMPAIGWVWAAYSTDPAERDYYRSWERALKVAQVRGEGQAAILAVPFLITGVLRGRSDPKYLEWFAALSTYATTTIAKQAVGRVLAGMNTIKEHLPVSARIALVELNRNFSADIPILSHDVADEGRSVLNGLLDVELQAPRAIAFLGKGIWDRLEPRTQEYVCQTLGLYQSFQQCVGDTRDYCPVFGLLANAIVHQIDVQFSHAMKLPEGMFFESGMYKEMIGKKYQKSLGSLPYLFEHLEKSNDVLVGIHLVRLKARGIQLDKLKAIARQFPELAKTRNVAAHAEDKIDRDWASAVYGTWFNKGLLKELFEALAIPA